MRTLILRLAFGIALLFLVFPNVVIQPYTAQNSTALAISLFMLRYQHAVEAACCLIAAGSLFLSRSVPISRWNLAAVSFVFVFAMLSRIDVYERMFHPLGMPAFQTVAETKLDGDEHLLAVNLGGARAYPIRTLSYHHIVNDYMGGVPIAVTY
jgi:hypothetical protein